jgi:hypothetical protein
MYLDLAKHAAEAATFTWAQNVDVNLSGAFTGETSAEMLKDIGANTSSSATPSVVPTTKNPTSSSRRNSLC